MLRVVAALSKRVDKNSPHMRRHLMVRMIMLSVIKEIWIRASLLSKLEYTFLVVYTLS